MGLISKLFGDSRDPDVCPYCGQPLQGWECVSCKVEFVSDGGYPVEAPPSRLGGAEVRCTACDSPMPRTAVRTEAWEDGDNAEAYVTCPGCGYHNAI